MSYGVYFAAGINIKPQLPYALAATTSYAYQTYQALGDKRRIKCFYSRVTHTLSTR